MNNFKIYSLIFIGVLFASIVQAQNNTSSPYTFYGIGDIANESYGRSLGLGGAGYGVRSSRFLNMKNPASLTAIDSLSVLFETGVNAKYTWSANSDHNAEFIDGNITHLMLGHRITDWLMGAFGAMPYSNIGYSIRTVKSIERDDNFVYSNWTGTGGLNKVFYSLGLRINKNFSIGGEGGYLYGPINQQRDTYIVSTARTSYYMNNRYSAFTYKLAAQFTAKLDEEGTSLTIGGSYIPEIKLRGKSDLQIYQVYGGVSDSVYAAEVTAKSIYLPSGFGAGLSFTYKGKYMFAADFEQHQWDMANSSKEYKSQQIYSFGFERVPQPSSLKFYDRCAYRIGFRYDTGYLNIRGQDISDMRLSIGYGLPILKSNSMINMTLEAGQKGTTVNGLVRERYTKFTMAFSMQDFWFTMRKFD